MKTLSVCNPWAWAIIHGNKKVENRNQPTSYRGPLLIHASLSQRYRDPRHWQHLIPGLPPWNTLIFGAVIGQVNLAACVPFAAVEGDPFAHGPWCWLLENPRPIEPPIPCRGQISFFDVPLPGEGEWTW